jgi:hypothetical protein
MTLNPATGVEKNSDPGSEINIPDPQHCCTNYSDAPLCLGEVAPLEGANLLYEVRLHVPLSVVQELETDGHREGSREVGCLSFTSLKQTEMKMSGVSSITNNTNRK